MERDGALKRKDTTKGPPIRILSLDGGGVRGYSMLIIIQELMHRTYVDIEGKAPRRDQIPKPCDHFDLIMGTGTGGLIAIMLGRLRLDLETCKEVYVRMTRKVFETDKTIAGIPYRSTLFKASKLEEAIKECVQEHTIYEKEGNDGDESDINSPVSPFSMRSSRPPVRAPSNASVVSFSNRSPTSYRNRPISGMAWGNPDALLYDNRDNRTKTAVTAIYKNTPKGGQPAILRSYDARKEPSPEYNCTIWQAGRATCATGLAFKPITVGQSVFHDEGAGQYNPMPFALDEACQNEWPGRDVGVVVSVGTGKRPAGSDHNQHMWYEGFMGEFAEARRRLIAKIEGCEETHQYMVREYLNKRNINIENYFRFNVEIGVGEFSMNEWYRLADISTNTRRYLAKSEVQNMNIGAAAKLAKIHRAKARFEHSYDGYNIDSTIGSNASSYKTIPEVPEAYPTAVELPAVVPENFSAPPPRSPPPRPSYESGHDNLEVPTTKSSPSPRSSQDSHATPPSRSPNRLPPDPNQGIDGDKLTVHAPTPDQYRTAGGADKIAIMSVDEFLRPLAQAHPARVEPPPLPPKTPLPDGLGSANPRPGKMPGAGPGMPKPGRQSLPYPLEDGPPPPVNRGKKPEYKGL